jgi:hypothetical protein
MAQELSLPFMGSVPIDVKFGELIEGKMEAGDNEDRTRYPGIVQRAVDHQARRKYLAVESRGSPRPQGGQVMAQELSLPFMGSVPIDVKFGELIEGKMEARSKGKHTQTYSR